MVSVTKAARQTVQLVPYLLTYLLTLPAEELYDHVVRKNWAAAGAAADQY